MFKMTKNWVDIILNDSDYHLSLFSNSEIQKLEKNIIEKNSKPYINCIIREKEVQLKPEEIVRQFYALKLINEYGYPKKRIRFEHPVQFGRETKSADIVVFDKDPNYKLDSSLSLRMTVLVILRE